MTFDQANIQFEKAVKQLQENLRYLVTQDKVSARFVSIQNGILRSLINYQHAVIRELSSYDQVILDSFIKNSRLYFNTVEAKECLEAICLIHGISDLQSWLNRGKDFLIGELVHHQRMDQIQLPLDFMKVVRGLSPQDYELFWQIINRKSYERWEIEFRELRNKWRAYA